MPSDRNSYVPVQTNVVLQTLVQAVHERVQGHRSGGAPESIRAVLESTDERLAGDNEPSLEQGLRLQGYFARVVETELFEPAQRPAGWPAERLSPYYARARDKESAIVALCGDLARAEPIERPEPDDPDAMSWQVPGPGGHVRHYVARRAIEELLQERDSPVDGDPADLKRSWLYGFFVRTCEEALAEEPDEPAAEADARE